VGCGKFISVTCLDMLQQFDTIVFCIFLPHIFDVIELNFNKCAFHAKTW
jgi:hypothetical protein